MGRLFHLAVVVLMLPACSGLEPSADEGEAVDAAAPTDAAPSDAGEPVDAAPGDAGPNDGAPNDAAQPDSGADAAVAGPLVFNIIIRQTVQACSGCGIWFYWQGVQSQKPRLVVEYQHLGQPHTAEVQHGLNGMDNAHSIYTTAQNDGAMHSMLVKQTPRRNGLFMADISDIPGAATIVSATLHLHIETDEGLANSDNSSVLAVHVCDRPWNWDHVTWTNYDDGLAWTQAGGDFGALIREIRAKEDLHDLGFSKANPNATFDFTDHVQQLQAARD